MFMFILTYDDDSVINQV